MAIHAVSIYLGTRHVPSVFAPKPFEIRKTHLDLGLHDATRMNFITDSSGWPRNHQTSICLPCNTANLPCNTECYIYLGCTQYGSIGSQLDILNTLDICLHYDLIFRDQIGNVELHHPEWYCQIVQKHFPLLICNVCLGAANLSSVHSACQFFITMLSETALTCPENTYPQCLLRVSNVIQSLTS